MMHPKLFVLFTLILFLPGFPQEETEGSSNDAKEAETEEISAEVTGNVEPETAAEQFSKLSEGYFADFKKHLLYGFDNCVSTGHFGGGAATLGKDFYSIAFYEEPKSFTHEVKKSDIIGVSYEAIVSVPTTFRAQALKVTGRCKDLSLPECLKKGGKIKKVISDTSTQVVLQIVYHFKDEAWTFVRVDGVAFDRYVE